MPIYQNSKDIDNALIVEFGSGDILMAEMKDTETGEHELGFILTEPRPIGAEAPEFCGKRSDEVNCRVRLKFTKKDSLDVLIEELQGLRKRRF